MVEVSPAGAAEPKGGGDAGSTAKPPNPWENVPMVDVDSLDEKGVQDAKRNLSIRVVPAAKLTEATAGWSGHVIIMDPRCPWCRRQLGALLMESVRDMNVLIVKTASFAEWTDQMDKEAWLRPSDPNVQPFTGSVPFWWHVKDGKIVGSRAGAVPVS